MSSDGCWRRQEQAEEVQPVCRKLTTPREPNANALELRNICLK